MRNSFEIAWLVWAAGTLCPVIAPEGKTLPALGVSFLFYAAALIVVRRGDGEV